MIIMMIAKKTEAKLMNDSQDTQRAEEQQQSQLIAMGSPSIPFSMAKVPPKEDGLRKATAWVEKLLGPVFLI